MDHEMLAPDELDALVDTVRRLLADRADESAVRAAMDTPHGHDRDLWRALGELGLHGLIVPVAQGGAGLGAVALERVMEVMGAALLCGPYLASSVLAAALARELGAAHLLRGIAAGTRIATLAMTGDTGDWTRESVAVTCAAGALSGHAAHVLDAQNADTLLVVARDGADIAIVAVAADAPGVTITPLPSFDRTRRLARVTFEGARGEAIGRGWEPVARALALGVIALAGDQAGGARAIFDRTVTYVGQRHQFGRPVGGFQAIKHMAADLLLECESATSAARHAAQCHDDAAPEAPLALALAAFACAEIHGRVAADAIQMHGGIGFTWAHGAHLHLRRARANAQLLGTVAQWRERFVEELCR